MSPQDLLNCSDDQLKTIALSSDLESLKRIVESVRHQERGGSLYAGQATNEESAQALSVARKAFQLATYNGNQQLLTEAKHNLARSLLINEKYQEAIPYYRDVVEKLDSAGDFARASRVRLGYMTALYYSDHYPEAFAVASRAEDWFLANNDEVGFARLCHNMAALHHRRNEHADAFRYHLMAVDIFKKLGDQNALAHSYFNMANNLAYMDQFEKSDEMYEQAIELSSELGLTNLYDQANYNRAYLHYLRGRYSDALHGFAQLRQRFEQSGSRRHFALCDLDEAEIYLQLGLSQDAAVLADRAAEQFKELGLVYEQAKVTAFYGVAMMQLRRFSEALSAFRVAQKMFEAEGNDYWIALLDLYRSEVHFSLQRYWEAQSLATQAKASFEKQGIISKRIFSLVLLGRVHLALNDLMAAEACVNEIFFLIKNTKVPLLLFPCHVLRAEIAERTRQFDQAEHHYELAAKDLERHQARIHHDDLRVTFFKGRLQVYEALVRLSLDRMGPEEGLAAAYAWCEHARSRGLVELLAHYAPSGRGHVEQSLLDKINRLREELNIFYARSNPDTQPNPSAPNYENVVFKEHELALALREVSTMDAEYASLQQVSIATIDSVREVLPERTTLIEYFTSGEEVLVFIVTRDGARVIRRLCPISRAVGLQERLSFQLEKFTLGGDYAKAHAGQILESTQRHLQALYRHLVAPFIAEIQTPHIIIVPHGTLHFLPFHAFFDGEKYLIDEFEVSYAPSASVLTYCLAKKEVAGATPLLVGVSDENAPLVMEEIKTLSRMAPNARILSNGNATRAGFVEECKTSLFLHIATHAIFRQDNPMFSSFKLADGWFTAFDLFSMTCQTNLVTLSGCKSGMSEVTGSDDLLGLMRGFLYAGARSLLLSLWNVSDESTAELMAHFYREWLKGVGKSTALRLAMQAVRDKDPNPFHWAPFLLAGNP